MGGQGGGGGVLSRLQRPYPPRRPPTPYSHAHTWPLHHPTSPTPFQRSCRRHRRNCEFIAAKETGMCVYVCVFVCLCMCVRARVCVCEWWTLGCICVCIYSYRQIIDKCILGNSCNEFLSYLAERALCVPVVARSLPPVNTTFPSW